MTRQRIIYLLFIVCGAVLQSYSMVDPRTAHIKVINVTDGLPDNSINDIVEDEYGFIWIATWNGLARFDGKYITSYRHNIDGGPNYLCNMIRCILPEKDGLWVGNDTGLDFFRYDDNKFYPTYCIRRGEKESLLNTRVSKVIKHNADVFALTVDGEILRLDKPHSKDDGTRSVFHVLPKPNNRRYADLTEFIDGKIIALSNDGITILSRNAENELLHNPFHFGYDPNLNLYYDKLNKRITVGGGIGSETKEFNIDKAGRLTTVNSIQPYSNLMSVAADDDTMFFGTDGHGMFIKEDGRLYPFTPDNSPLPCDAIYKVYVDSRHNLWLGSYRYGVFMLSHNLNAYAIMDKHSGRLCYDIVTAVIPEGEMLYLGLDGGGIEVMNALTGEYRSYTKSNSGMPADNVVSLSKDGNVLWAAVYGTGLVKCDLANSQFTTFKADGKNEPGNKLWVIRDDGEGNLWVGGNSLSVFDKQTQKFTLIPGTQESDVLSMVIDHNNIFVATRWNGLLQVDRRRRAVVERYSDSPSKGGVKLPGNKTPFVFVDSKHQLWVDVDNAMLCRIDPSAKKILKTYRHRTDDTGIQVLSMVEDNRGNIFIGTNHGLLKYIRKKDCIVSLNDERMPRMFTFNAASKDKDTAYFGTTSGLLKYPINQGVENTRLASLVFTDLKIFNNGGESLPLFSTGDTLIELDNDQNFFQISFTLPEMSNPEQIKFECKLEGFENEWRDVSATRSTIYTYVPAGKYKLSVRHTMPNGSWSIPTSISIKIRPAWYATPLMIIVWILLALTVLGAVVYVWYKFIKNHEKIHIAEVERESANRLNEAKLDFYANITHELRTPCFLISAQIEEMYDSGRQSIPVNNLGGIYRNSAKLNRLINHIIDFRKTDTGHLSLNTRYIDVQILLGELSKDYEQLCHQKSITFSFDYTEPPVMVEVDPDKLELIVTNLITNAYKYTPKGGTVTLGLKENETTIEISVTDNGIGIVDKLQTAIFEPFVRTDRGQKISSGDGIGLAFVKELVELHHGNITVESKVNEGSKFIVTIPKRIPEAKQTEPDTKSLPFRPKEKRFEQAPHTETEPRITDPTCTRSILLIDDNPEVLSILAKAFEDKYRVTEMSDAKEAVEMVRKGGYDVVITDLMMPDFDGHQVLRELKGNKRTKDVKVIVLSALISEKDMLAAFDEGADVFLTKPIPVKVLVRQVERLFEQNDDETALPMAPGNYSREEQKFLLECRRVINECMTLDDFDIAMLASRLSMSHSTLYKKIKGMTGMSVIDFINEYRIYKAVQLFKDGVSNVQTVAEMCGFKDVKTFRETFKRKMNMAPKQFMLKIQED